MSSGSFYFHHWLPVIHLDPSRHAQKEKNPLALNVFMPKVLLAFTNLFPSAPLFSSVPPACLDRSAYFAPPPSSSPPSSLIGGSI